MLKELSTQNAMDKMLTKVTSKLQVLAKALSGHVNRRRPSHASARTVPVTVWLSV
jgi:hypothetical protein